MPPAGFFPLVHAGPSLSSDDFERYAPQLALPEIGAAGQARLKAGRVAVVGAGGLGSPVLSYLAAAGVGSLTVIDGDTVALSNLHRQLLHSTSDVGRDKAKSAFDALTASNPDVVVTTHATVLTGYNAHELLAGHDLVVDGSDNFATHYLLDDAAAELDLPCVWGSVLRWHGQTSVSWVGHGPRYRDLYPNQTATPADASCSAEGVLGPVCGVIGSIMATQVITLLTGAGTPLLGSLLLFDGQTMEFRTVRYRSQPGSPETKHGESVASMTASESLEGNPMRANHAGDQTEIDSADLAQLLASGEPVTLIDVREPHEHQAGAITGSVLAPVGTLLDSAREAYRHGGEAGAKQRVAELVPGLATDNPAVVYCAHGVRSAHALSLLQQLGFTGIRNLTGGYADWAAHQVRA